MLYLIIFFICGIITLSILAWIAPVGYEDETGFHYGETNMTYEERRDLHEQQEFNKKVLNLCGLWLSGFLGGFSLMFILWLWFC
jgi:hypothetical protein